VVENRAVIERRRSSLRSRRTRKRSQKYRVSDGIARIIIQFVKKCEEVRHGRLMK
jgi:hypothetical protein